MSDVIVPLPMPFEDARGEIQPLVDQPLGSFLRIVSHAGTVRANHYHLRDFHFCFVERGMVDYYSRPVGSKLTPKHVRVYPGNMFYTPPMTEHCMVFPVETCLFVVAKNERHQAEYEADTVRVDPIQPREAG